MNGYSCFSKVSRRLRPIPYYICYLKMFVTNEAMDTKILMELTQ